LWAHDIFPYDFKAWIKHMSIERGIAQGPQQPRMVRSPDWGMMEGLAEACSPERSLAMFRKMCLTRYFDLRVRQAQLDNDIECLIYLSVGQEAVAAAVAVVMEGCYVLGQHRGHSVYLSFGGRPERLADELLGMSTGCCGGMGGSPPSHDFERKIVAHNGLIGDQVPVAAGIALAAPGERVICFFGDGAAEEDYVLATLGFVATKKLPLLFVCEDNDLSVLTPTVERRNWSVVDVAQGFGLNAVDITDDPWLIEYWTTTLADQLPAIINIRTCREFWHNGTGSDNNAEWSRFDLTKAKLTEIGLRDKARAIELEIKTFVEDLWNERLQRRSAI
tara:strand:- start:127 stop:1125 length:999 start_codon:yes stop_codon:yes gene_type:complete